MRKLKALRQALITAVPYLVKNPDRLLTFVEEGSLRWYKGGDLNHGLNYTAQLVVTDFAGDLDQLTLPLLDWLAQYNPDIDPNEGISFEAEILSDDAVDVLIRAQLNERVIVTRTPNGGLNAEHRMPAFNRVGGSQMTSAVLQVEGSDQRGGGNDG